MARGWAVLLALTGMSIRSPAVLRWKLGLKRKGTGPRMSWPSCGLPSPCAKNKNLIGCDGVASWNWKSTLPSGSTAGASKRYRQIVAFTGQLLANRVGVLAQHRLGRLSRLASRRGRDSLVVQSVQFRFPGSGHAGVHPGFSQIIASTSVSCSWLAHESVIRFSCFSTCPAGCRFSRLRSAGYPGALQVSCFLS